MNRRPPEGRYMVDSAAQGRPVVEVNLAMNDTGDDEAAALRKSRSATLEVVRD